MGTKKGNAHVMQLRDLLTRAGHFQRPMGRRGSRILGVETEHGVEFADGVPEGHVERVIERLDATNRVTGSETLIGRGPWQAREGWRVVEERRSSIDARADAVCDLRKELEEHVVPLLRAGVLAQPKIWHELLGDDLLDSITVGQALASLEEFNEPGVIGKAYDFVQALRREKDAQPNGMSADQIVQQALGRPSNSDDRRVLRKLRGQRLHDGLRVVHRDGRPSVYWLA